MDAVAMLMLAMEAKPLTDDLHGWEPVGVLIEVMVGALQGGEGISEHEVRRLRSWVRRWLALPVDLRRFYEEQAPAHPAAGAALWCILDGTPGNVWPATSATVHRLWKETRGEDPPWSLIPKVP